MAIEQKYATPYGDLECYECYVVFHLKTTEVTVELAKHVLGLSNDHYKGRKYVFISEREFASNVDPEAYKFVNPRQMIGHAIVSEDANVKAEAVSEMELFKGTVSFFPSVKEAANWAETVVRPA
ncbi:hypothetical protein [Luteirhabdus pelagi]|uniref:hypothetical protein n=1 Tax=Luteirhabdus pelagi TaxID=2792783 RepID=UPI00193AA702|nr:hypothetical protein [Luteirhabdus pelagi]